MAPSPPATCRDTPPISQLKTYEYNTITKTPLFNIYDEQCSSTSIRSIATRSEITEKTARRWPREQDIQGSPPYRRSRKKSLRLSRPSKLSHEVCQMLVSPSQTSVRHKAQIQHYNLNVSTSTVQ